LKKLFIILTMVAAMEIDEVEDASNNDLNTTVLRSAKKERGEAGSSRFLKQKSDENLMWVEKYRPKDLDDVLSHKDIINTIKRLVRERKLPHLLFYGPPGTGKTTTILAAARELNGPKYQAMTLELNASDDRGIDVVRNQIKTFASTKQIWAQGFKIIILDEADSMTNTAQFALRRIIEQFTKNTRFCMICNFVNKINPALRSRCTRYRFAPLNPDDIVARLKQIGEKEGVDMDEDALEAIIKLAAGDMRKCLNVLQSCHMSYDRVTRANVYLCTGAPLPEEIQNLLGIMLNETFSEAYTALKNACMHKGLALIDVVQCMVPLVESLDLSEVVLGYLTANLADLDNRLAKTCSTTLQISSLVSIFVNAKEMQREREKLKQG